MNNGKPNKKFKVGVDFKTRLGVMTLSLCISLLLFLFVTAQSNSKDVRLLDTDGTDAVYVIENIDIDYQYDKTKYEVVPFIVEPYAVVKGDTTLVNLLKWSGKPKFHIDLMGKPPGTYKETISYTGIHSNLKVEFYPSIVDLRIMEQQTVRYVPTIELKGVDVLGENYIVSVPVLDKSEVKIRDIQDKLNQVSQVKGVIDVSKMTKTTDVQVPLEVYDREGKIIENINLLDKSILVTVPIEKKVTVVKEEVINEIIVIEGKEDKDNSDDENTQKPVKEGYLSFVNIPKNLEVRNNSEGLVWSDDIKVDLKSFEEGKYEMTIDDKGEKKTIHFELVNKDEESISNSDSEDAESPTESDESNSDKDANMEESKEES